LVTTVSCAIADEPINMAFRVKRWYVGQRNHVLNGGLDLPIGEEAILGAYPGPM